MIDLNSATYPPAPPVHYDLDAIVARLRATAETWVPRQFRHGRWVGDEWRLANIRGDAPRKNGSCVIALKGERAGDWHEFDGCEGGGPLSALEASEKLTGRELFAYAAELVGWVPNIPARVEPVPLAAKAERDPSREIAFILEHSVPIAGAPAAAYLASRGLEPVGANDLLAHQDLTHWEMKAGYPAVIGVVRNPAGEAVAVHRTYLQVDLADPGKVTKAAVPKPRMMLGKMAGGAVRLAPIDPGAALGLCEGIETGLAVMTSCPGLPVWATLSATNLEQVILPPEARRIVILADHDASGAGTRAAETAARRLRGEGREVVIAVPPRKGWDFNDVLLREGRGAVAAIVGAAFNAKAGKEPAKAVDATGRHLPVGFSEPTGSMPTLRSDEGDLARAVERVWSVLLASNRSPWVFRAGGLPSWVVPDDEGRPMVAPLTEERLRHILAKLANWRRMNAKGDIVPAHPPTLQVKSLLATPDPALPVLAGIVTTPVFGRAGVLLTEPGYHSDARLLYAPAAGFELPEIPEKPTAQEVAAARSLICEDLLGEFPFTSLAERAHAVSLLLLGFLRAMIDGPTPLHLIEKPTPGTGATLMVDAIATILTGSGAGVMTEGTDEEEWRKRITAKLRQIPTIVLIDNLKRQLDASALAAALTAPFWEDRVLGVSEITRLPIRCLWIATGNNPTFSNEMARRLVRIRLDSHVDRPWQRSGFRHPDLMVWVRANRARLVAACLTLCRAWLAAGRPQGTRTIGSYESWSQTVGGVLEVAGIEGFLTNIEEMMSTSDSEGAVWRGFVSVWWDRFGAAEVGTGDLFTLAADCEPPLPLGSGNEKSQRTRLGIALVRMRDRVFQISSRNLRLEASRISHKLQRWRLAVDEKTDTGTGTLGTPVGASTGYLEPVRGTLSDHVPLEKHQVNQGFGVPGVPGVPFPTLTHARAHAPVREDGEKGTPRTPGTPSADDTGEFWRGTCGGTSGSTSPNPKSARLARGCAVMRRPNATGPPAAQTPQSRATTESSAKNRSVAALTTTTPSMEIIMAETTVTTLADGARLLPVYPTELSSRVVLALDLGTTTGWAMALDDGGIVSGTVSFRPSRYDGGGMRYVRFRAWLDGIAEDTPGIAAIHFEEVRRHLSTDAAHVHGGLLAMLTAWCEERSIAYQGVPVGTIKRHITGKGNADKAAVIAAVRARGYNPADDNEADAIAILLWALETGGGVR